MPAATPHESPQASLHVLKWNGSTMTLPAVPKKVTDSALLTDGNVKVVQTEPESKNGVAPEHQQKIDHGGYGAAQQTRLPSFKER